MGQHKHTILFYASFVFMLAKQFGWRTVSNQQHDTQIRIITPNDIFKLSTALMRKNIYWSDRMCMPVFYRSDKYSNFNWVIPNQNDFFETFYTIRSIIQDTNFIFYIFLGKTIKAVNIKIRSYFLKP